jgi:oligo-1,6-glucosidase
MRLPDDDRVYAFTRRLGDVELFVLGNFAAHAAPVPEAREWASAELLLANCPAPEDHGVLEPWEARVYRRGP